jgi:hypothetical protein
VAIEDHKRPLYFECTKDIMCFEFEIPNRMKSKNLNVINEEDVEIEPELEKVEEPVTVSVN